MFASIAILVFLPWLDTSPVKSAALPPAVPPVLLGLRGRCACCLGWLGAKPAEGGYVIASRIATALLLRALPDHPAAARPVRDAAPDARIDRGGGARQAGLGERHGGGRRGLAEHQGLRRANGVETMTIKTTLRRSRLLGRRASAAVSAQMQVAHAAGDAGTAAAPELVLRGTVRQPTTPTQLQRGFKVYREVCSACHSIKLLAFRNLSRTGRAGVLRRPGQGARRRVQGHGRPQRVGRDVRARRRARPTGFPSPFPNRQAAQAANGGAYPPDLSVHRQGPHLRARLPLVRDRHLHAVPGAGRRTTSTALLTGYEEPPAGLRAAGRQVLQQVLPRPRHRDAAAGSATGRSSIPRTRMAARRLPRPRRSIPRTCRRS